MRNAFAAAGADAQLAGQVAQRRGPAFDRRTNVAIRHALADANYHGGIVNANANDCQ
jgi:hypothetical protein